MTGGRSSSDGGAEPSATTPLGQQAELTARRMRTLLDTVRYDPPTPGVATDARRQLARELRLEPRALRRACMAHLTDDAARSRIETYVRTGEDLARAVEDREDIVRTSRRINEHLDEFVALVEEVEATSGTSSSQLATEFAEARDNVVYGL